MALSLLLKSMSPWPKPREQLKLKSVTASTRGREVSEVDILVWRTIDWEGRGLRNIFHMCF